MQNERGQLAGHNIGGANSGVTKLGGVFHDRRDFK